MMMGDTDTGKEMIGKSNYSWSNTAPSIAVIDAIAAIENVKSSDLEGSLDAPLFNYIDPEALDRLITSDSQIKVSFTFDEYYVLIDRDGLSVSYD
ncbi:hypothetical protein EA472_02405 [Natrarchaeobius oligotrophus]|uniref:Halobacterial output domain-containing protein n=2 Tax=Natrarchaeobius TaxID=2501796 RepID=A0A3N6N3D2_NATCH|nr:hypothetical protein EA472_02405 [Natrarchaeobius chitinivorans]